eukprot:NODE_6437_length_1672_cov_13.377346.p6 GENE.NODE_6437_length_1672_cov_13.377346~~NODE_6437_length_1672_cov_13.377346.p6  ORF type:complete len:192 (-),score=42.11 NODE_6437_length_1672_cov_13.377346:152-727(-)
MPPQEMLRSPQEQHAPRQLRGFRQRWSTGASASASTAAPRIQSSSPRRSSRLFTERPAAVAHTPAPPVPASLLHAAGTSGSAFSPPRGRRGQQHARLEPPTVPENFDEDEARALFGELENLGGARGLQELLASPGSQSQGETVAARAALMGVQLCVRAVSSPHRPPHTADIPETSWSQPLRADASIVVKGS